MPNIVRRESQIIRKGDDPVADVAVKEIGRLWKISEESLEKSLEYRFKVGQYLIDYFYDSDIENAQKNKFAPNRQNSFANMLRHENLPTQCKSSMTISNLIYSSAVYQGLIARGLPLREHIKNKEITYTHFVILARLKKDIQVDDQKYSVLDFDRIQEYTVWSIENGHSTADLQSRVSYYNKYLKGDEDFEPKVIEEIPQLEELNKELLSPLDADFLSDWEKYFAYDGTSRENYIIPERVNEMKSQIQRAIKNYNAAIGHLRSALARIEIKKMVNEYREQKNEESSVIIDDSKSVINNEPLALAAK